MVRYSGALRRQHIYGFRRLRGGGHDGHSHGHSHSHSHAGTSPVDGTVSQWWSALHELTTRRPEACAMTVRSETPPAAVGPHLGAKCTNSRGKHP
jgi:hypothetical protein